MKKIILFGDSITYGYNGNNPMIRFSFYQDSLMKLFNAQNLSDIQLKTYGIPGEDTRQARLRLERDVLREQPDIAVIFFGANDAASYHDITPEEYAENLAFFAEQIGMEKTILVTPPFYDETKGNEWRNNQEIERYRAELLAMADSLGIAVVDIYAVMTRVDEPNEFLQEDGLHFSEYGYKFLAAFVAEEIRKKLSTDM